MYFAMAGEFAARVMEGASLVYIGRSMRRAVARMGAGRGASDGVLGASSCAAMVAGCAGVGWVMFRKLLALCSWKETTFSRLSITCVSQVAS
jgi:hypothetical protein